MDRGQSPFPRLNRNAPPTETGKSSIALGVVQLMLGVFSGVLAISAIIVRTSYSYTGYGLWCGMMYVVAGSVTVALGSRPYRDLVSASVGMNIVAAVFAAVQISLGSVSIYYNGRGVDCGTCSASSTYDYCTEWTSTELSCVDVTAFASGIFTATILLVIGVIELCFALATAGLGCGCFDPAYNPNRIEIGSVEETYRTQHYPPSGIHSTKRKIDPSPPANRNENPNGRPYNWSPAY